MAAVQVRDAADRPLLLGAVRQILFNARFGVGPKANAYYAAFRLPDTLFSLIAGGALSAPSVAREAATRAVQQLSALALERAPPYNPVLPSLSAIVRGGAQIEGEQP
jgi:hypothetical protein